MSERSRAARGFSMTLAGALAIAVSAPRPSIAQSSAKLDARLVTALHNRASVVDSINALKARHALDLPPDSLTSGIVRVRYSARNLGPDLLATLTAAVRRAGSIADMQFGDAKLDAPAPGSVVLVDRVEGPRLGLISFDAVRVELPGGRGRISVIRRPVTERKLADNLLDMIGTLATNGLPAEVKQWAGYWAPSHPLTDGDWTDAALDLTTSSSFVTRTCYSGSLAACKSALGLTPVRDPLTEWYTPDGWRALVSTWDPPVGDPALRAAHSECVEKKIMATCERLARSRHVPVPLNLATRSTLFNLAIARGGQSAYTRLRNATGTPIEILSKVAGVGPDVLLDDWRGHVLAAVPHSAVPSGAETAVLIAWTALFGFAATRRRLS